MWSEFSGNPCEVALTPTHILSNVRLGRYCVRLPYLYKGLLLRQVDIPALTVARDSDWTLL